ncbi:MAG: hypothetical protein NVS1B12_15480 [Acidimicrobiales bacterium]
MDDTDPLVERLRDLGRQPVDPATASQHLSAMGSVRRPIRGWRRYRVGAAFFAGLLVGGTGLASAGALPGGVQNAAHTTLSEVGVNVPDGHGPARSTVGCPADGVTYKNHGQYVRTHHNDPNAGASQCGKPVNAGADEQGGTEAPESPEPTEAPDAGKPATPGANGHGHGNGHGNGHGKGQGNQGQGNQGQDEQGPQTPEPTEAPTVAPKVAPLAPATPPSTTTTSTTEAPTTTTSTSTTSTTTLH